MTPVLPTPRPAADPLLRQVPPPAGAPARQPGRISAAELFSQLFPAGVQMTGELFSDLEQWARLTSKLTAQDGGTAP